jgi:hypothetical protein
MELLPPSPVDNNPAGGLNKYEVVLEQRPHHAALVTSRDDPQTDLLYGEVQKAPLQSLVPLRRLFSSLGDDQSPIEAAEATTTR